MRRSHRAAKILLVVYSVFLAAVLFSPTSDRQNDAVVWLGSVLVALGVPEHIVMFGRLEVVMNVAIIAPVTFLGSIVQPRLSWRDWTAWGFVVAVGVELAQGLLLPDRETSFSDVVANTAGALAGAGLFVAVRLMLRRRTRS